MSTDDLPCEVHKLYLQKPIDKDYFTQIHEVIRDRASTIILLNRSLKSETAQVKSDIAQNASLATDNDSRLKEGLARLEAHVIVNGVATTEL